MEKIDLTQAPWIECEEKNTLFESKLLFKKISSEISPSGKEELIPVEIVICSKCGKVPSFFYEKAKDIPDAIRSKCKFT